MSLFWDYTDHIPSIQLEITYNNWHKITKHWQLSNEIYKGLLVTIVCCLENLNKVCLCWPVLPDFNFYHHIHPSSNPKAILMFSSVSWLVTTFKLLVHEGIQIDMTWRKKTKLCTKVSTHVNVINSSVHCVIHLRPLMRVLSWLFCLIFATFASSLRKLECACVNYSYQRKR